MLPEKTKPTGDKPYTTDQIRQILTNTTNLKFKAMINFMASSGVRIGSFEEMRLRDLEDHKDVTLIKDQTPDQILKTGLIEKIFGGVGKRQTLQGIPQANIGQ